MELSHYTILFSFSFFALVVSVFLTALRYRQVRAKM